MLNILSIHVLLRGRKPRIKRTQSRSCAHKLSYITWVDGGRGRWMKEGTRTRDFEGIRARVSQKHLTGVLCLSARCEHFGK